MYKKMFASNDRSNDVENGYEWLLRKEVRSQIPLIETEGELQVE